MAFYRTSFVHRYVFVAFIISRTFEICQAGLFHQETILCPPVHRHYPKQPCNTSTNCRFGGKCRKAADVSGRGTITRYVIPEESNDQRRLSGYESLEYRPTRHTGSRGAEICTCPYLCESRGSRQVCGTNGITYRSTCHLRRYSCRCQTDVKINYSGPCIGDAEIDVEVHQEQRLAPRVNTPMRSCAERCQFGGRCDDEGRCQCNIQCPAAESFVCGKDGRTYRNSCFLRRAQCEEQRGITIFHDGRCRLKSIQRRGVQCSHRCDSSLKDQVCGSDGVTYLNECLLKHASCNKGEQIDVVHKGQCGEQPPVQPTQDPCRGIYCEYEAVCVPDPVSEFMCSCDAICRADSTQNDNIVRLSVASSPSANSKWIDESSERPNRGKKRRGRKRKNRKRRRHRSRISRSRRSIDGSTAPRNVTLCGSDRKTYTNLCELKIHACHLQTNITVRHVGACPMVLPKPPKQVTPSKLPDIVEVPTEDADQLLHPYSTQRHKGGRHHSKERQIHKTQALGHDNQSTTLHTNTVIHTVVYSRIVTNSTEMTDLSDHEDDKTKLEPAANTRLEDDVSTAIVALEHGGSAWNPTRSALNIYSHEATTAMDISRSTRPVTGNPSTSKIAQNKDPNLSQRRSSSEIAEQLMTVTENSMKDENTPGLIKDIASRKDSPNHNLAPCESRAVSPSLQWYHVALISVATQILVIVLLIGICVVLKRRRRSKPTDDFVNKINATERSPKEEQGAESEKT